MRRDDKPEENINGIKVQKKEYKRICRRYYSNPLINIPETLVLIFNDYQVFHTKVHLMGKFQRGYHG